MTLFRYVFLPHLSSTSAFLEFRFTLRHSAKFIAFANYLRCTQVEAVVIHFDPILNSNKGGISDLVRAGTWSPGIEARTAAF